MGRDVFVGGMFAALGDDRLRPWGIASVKYVVLILLMH